MAAYDGGFGVYWVTNSVFNNYTDIRHMTAVTLKNKMCRKYTM